MKQANMGANGGISYEVAGSKKEATYQTGDKNDEDEDKEDKGTEVGIGLEKSSAEDKIDARMKDAKIGANGGFSYQVEESKKEATYQKGDKNDEDKDKEDKGTEVGGGLEKSTAEDRIDARMKDAKIGAKGGFSYQ